MSRTRRVNLLRLRPRCLWLRYPRGAKQAKIRGDRNIPPTSWDDLSFGRDVVQQARRAQV